MRWAWCFCLQKSLVMVLLGFAIDKKIRLAFCTNIWLQKQRNSSLVNLKSQAQASLWREWDFLTVHFAWISDCFFRMMFLTKTLIWLWIYEQISKCKMLICKYIKKSKKRCNYAIHWHNKIVCGKIYINIVEYCSWWRNSNYWSNSESLCVVRISIWR